MKPLMKKRTNCENQDPMPHFLLSPVTPLVSVKYLYYFDLGKAYPTEWVFQETNYKLEFRVQDVYYRILLRLIAVGERKEARLAQRAKSGLMTAFANARKSSGAKMACQSSLILDGNDESF